MEWQLLVLCQSCVNPGMLASAHVCQGEHDYSNHPFVPIGMEALVHEKPHKQQTYVQHCKKGFVLGTSFEHYSCQTVWMVYLHKRQTSGAFWFKHKYINHPSVTPADQIMAAIGSLAKMLTTGIPPRLRDNTLERHPCTRILWRCWWSKERHAVPRVTMNVPAPSPRVPTCPIL